MPTSLEPSALPLGHNIARINNAPSLNSFLSRQDENVSKELRCLQKLMRQPGIEPGSIAWKATMLTFTPPTLWVEGEMVLVVEVVEYHSV